MRLTGLPLALLLVFTGGSSAMLLLRTSPVTVAHASDARAAEADRRYQTGLAQLNQGQAQAALVELQQALQVYRGLGDGVGEGKTLTQLGWAYGDMQQPKPAQEQFQQAVQRLQVVLTEAQGRQDRPAMAAALTALGLAQMSLGRYSAAIATLDRAISLHQQLKDNRGEAQTLVYLSQAHSALNNLTEAIAANQRALPLWQQLGDNAAIAKTLAQLGWSQFGTFNYRQSITHFQQALPLLRHVNDKPGEALVLMGLGLAHFALADTGKYNKGMSLTEPTLNLFLQSQYRSRTTVQLGMGAGAYHRLNANAPAIAFYQQELPTINKLQRRYSAGVTILPDRSTSIVELSGYDTDLSNYGRAISFYQQAIPAFRQAQDRQGEADALSGLGNTYSRLGDFDKALEFYQQALPLYQQLGDRGGSALMLSRLGQLWQRQNQPVLAIILYKQAVAVYEMIRQDIRVLDASLQESYTDLIATTYRRLADLLLQQDRILEAQQVLDLLRVQELKDYLQNVRGDGIQPLIVLQPETEILKRYNQQQQTAIQVGQELAKLEAIPADHRTAQQQQRLTQLLNLQTALKQQFSQFITSKEIQAWVNQLSQLSDRQNVNPALLSSLQGQLTKLNAALLYPLILDDRLELILTTPNSPPLRRTVPVKRAELTRAIATFRRALINQDSSILALSQQLYSWLIQPIATELQQANIQTIIYAPDGQLRYIPLAALHDGQQWLVERYQVNHITAQSLSDLNRHSQPTLKVLAGAFVQGNYQVQVGDRQFKFGGLPFAGKEVANLAAMVPGTTQLLDTAFNRQTTLSRLTDYTVLHFATHAAFVKGQAEDSFILLGSGELLTLRDVENLTLRNTELVVLSACETGLGGVLGDGREILGLGYQFHRAGAKAVLASLWKVDDLSTQQLMDAFYQQLKTGQVSKAEAMRRAQVSLIREKGEHSDPYFWAAFILIGNGF